MQKQINLNDLLEIVEMKGSLNELLTGRCSMEQGKKILSKFKEDLKKQRKDLARRYHPDMSGGSVEKMQMINDAVDNLMKLEIQPQPVQRVVYYQYNPYGATTSTTFTSTGGGWY